jgi:hypothetical protein
LGDKELDQLLATQRVTTQAKQAPALPQERRKAAGAFFARKSAGPKQDVDAVKEAKATRTQRWQQAQVGSWEDKYSEHAGALLDDNAYNRFERAMSRPNPIFAIEKPVESVSPELWLWMGYDAVNLSVALAKQAPTLARGAYWITTHPEAIAEAPGYVVRGVKEVARAGVVQFGMYARKAAGFFWGEKAAKSLDWKRVGRDGRNAAAHVLDNHGNLKLSKEVQGVFYGHPIDVVENAWLSIDKLGIKPIKMGNRDVYIIPRGNTGYAGGYSGQLENFDHITIITETGTNKVVTAFPSGRTPQLPNNYKFTFEADNEYQNSLRR